jgi:ATP-dependent protease Clp ATPase subunit
LDFYPKKQILILTKSEATDLTVHQLIKKETSKIDFFVGSQFEFLSAIPCKKVKERSIQKSKNNFKQKAIDEQRSE